MSDRKERACTNCGSLLHHEDDCPKMKKDKSIEEIIKDEAEKRYPYFNGPDARINAARTAYIAGRSQNLAREKEYREALAELVRLKTIKDELDAVDRDEQDQEFLNKYANYRMDKIRAWNHAKTLVQLLKP